MTLTPAAALDPIDLSSPELLLNPYPFYHRLRSEAPVYYAEIWKAWVVTRYEDVRTILHDQRLSSARTPAFLKQLPESARQQLAALDRYMSLWIGFVDAPEHTRLRAVSIKALVPRLFEGLRPRIREVADELIGRVKDKGKLDGIWDLAYPLPATIIADLIGIPPEHRTAFKKSSDAFVALVGPSRPSLEKAMGAQTGLAAMIDFLRPVYEERRVNPQQDMMTVLMNCEVEGKLLDEEEVLLLSAALAIGGHETTTNLIGNGLLALMRNPEQKEKLQQHPEIITTAVDEILRYDSPLQRVIRVAKQDLEIGGQPIRQGELVLGMLGAANHDPAEFPDPDRLDLERAENRHLAFGQASRFCLGAHLARIEGQVVLARVLDELPNLHLVEPGPVWNENVGFRGLKTLPLAF